MINYFVKNKRILTNKVFFREKSSDTHTSKCSNDAHKIIIFISQRRVAIR